jgi:hypothetical protein
MTPESAGVRGHLKLTRIGAANTSHASVPACSFASRVGCVETPRGQALDPNSARRARRRLRGAGRWSVHRDDLSAHGSEISSPAHGPSLRGVLLVGLGVAVIAVAGVALWARGRVKDGAAESSAPARAARSPPPITCKRPRILRLRRDAPSRSGRIEIQRRSESTSRPRRSTRAAARDAGTAGGSAKEALPAREAAGRPERAFDRQHRPTRAPPGPWSSDRLSSGIHSGRAPSSHSRAHRLRPPGAHPHPRLLRDALRHPHLLLPGAPRHPRLLLRPSPQESRPPPRPRPGRLRAPPHRTSSARRSCRLRRLRHRPTAARALRAVGRATRHDILVDAYLTAVDLLGP